MKWMFTFLLLFPLILKGQKPNWHEVSIEPKVQIKQIIKDSIGFLWLHDEYSLFRFDGSKAVEKLNFKNEKITFLEHSISNQLLIGTSLGKVILFDYELGLSEIIYKDTLKEAITGIWFKNKDEFVLLKYGNGLTISRKKEIKHFNTSNGLLSDEVYCIKYLNEKLYLSSDQGIQILDLRLEQIFDRIYTIQDGLPDIIITNLEIHNNQLWFSDFNMHIGFITKDEIITTYELPTHAKINKLISHPTGIYISTDKGLYQYNKNEFNLKFESECKFTQLDNEGNIWITTNSEKLFKGNLSIQQIKINLKPIRALELYNNSITIGNENGVYKLLKDKFIKLIEEDVTCLKNINGYLFVGTFSDGVKIYNRNYKLIFELSKWNEVKNESVLNIYNIKNEVFISSLTGVMLFEFQNEILIPKYSLKPQIGQSYVYSMLSVNEKIYFGTDRDGIYEWNRQKGTSKNITKSKNGSHIGSVYSMTKDNNDKIWITSTELGLAYIENENVFQKDDIINLKDDYTSILKIDDNKLLLISGNSIDILDPDTLHMLSYDNEVDIENQITYLNNIVTDRIHTYFIHGNNLYSYQPQKNYLIQPQIIIDHIKSELTVIPINKSVFKQNENNIEFSFKGRWLTDPKKLSYEYKLEGFDSEWRKTKDNSVSFSKLPPNQYFFKVRASENEYFRNNPEANYAFEIKKSLHNTLWFRTLILIAVGFLLINYFRLREKRRKEHLMVEKLKIENQIINLKNQLNPHFLFNTLNTLIGLIEEDKERSIEFVEKISDFYRNMIEFGKVDLVSLEDEKQVLSQYIEILRARFEGQIHFDLSWDNTSRYQIPPFTLQLLVENAVKHNEASTQNPLTISIKQESDTIKIYNKKRKLLNSQSSTKTGLKNIKQRFVLVDLTEPKITNAETYFQIVIKLKSK